MAYREKPCRVCNSHNFDNSNRCQSCKQVRTAAWRAANKERSIAQTAKSRNKVRATEEGRLLHLANNREHQLRRRKRMPAWADSEAIKNFYINCPAGHHVDHIIPLQGKLVSGLHVLANLQYLPAADNIAKGNKFEAH